MKNMFTGRVCVLIYVSDLRFIVITSMLQHGWKSSIATFRKFSCKESFREKSFQVDRKLNLFFIVSVEWNYVSVVLHLPRGPLPVLPDDTCMNMKQWWNYIDRNTEEVWDQPVSVPACLSQISLECHECKPGPLWWKPVINCMSYVEAAVQRHSLTPSTWTTATVFTM
jgi:hypothetical protein